jgi:hypothetical protein
LYPSLKTTWLEKLQKLHQPGSQHAKAFLKLWVMVVTKLSKIEDVEHSINEK